MSAIAITDPAQQVAINFKRDLVSDSAKQVHSQLRRLHLPTALKPPPEHRRHAIGSGATRDKLLNEMLLPHGPTLAVLRDFRAQRT